VEKGSGGYTELRIVRLRIESEAQEEDGALKDMIVAALRFVPGVFEPRVGSRLRPDPRGINERTRPDGVSIRGFRK
jgi:hypothetical protein